MNSSIAAAMRGFPVLFLAMVVVLHSSASDDRAKSLVLKDRVPEKNLFHFESDNSRREMWNEFMLVRDANSGDPVAQHELGLRYLMGKGFPADTQKAAYWIAKAADQNLMPARYNLGILYNNGISVSWNPFEAYRHFKYCAEHGMMESQYVYGLLLTDNLTVPRNYAEAYRWIKMAADSGYVPAQEALAEFRQRGLNRNEGAADDDSRNDKTKSSRASPAGGKKNSSPVRPVILDFASDSISVPGWKELLQEALLDANARLKDDLLNVSLDDTKENADSARWREIRESAEAGNPEALTLIGFRYEEGSSGRPDPIAATVYYLRAIRYESSPASLLLFKLLRSENYFRTLKASVDADDPRAQFSWAGLTAFGFDHQLTESQSMELLTKAARQGFSPAIVELGIRHYTGASVNQDRGRALELFDQAARLGSREALLRSSMMKLNASHGSAPDSNLLNVLSRFKDEGSVLAEEILGYLYATGAGGSRNLPESVRYYRKAAQRGSTIAYDALRDLYDGIRPRDAEFQIQN